MYLNPVNLAERLHSTVQINPVSRKGLNLIDARFSSCFDQPVINKVGLCHTVRLYILGTKFP